MAASIKQPGDPNYLSALIDSGGSKGLTHEKAFGHFYHDQCRRVTEAVRKALRGSCDQGLVEDLTHDIILKIHSALQRGRYQPGGNFNGFVWRVATNSTLNHLRDTACRERILRERITHEPIATTAVDGAPSDVNRETLLRLISLLPDENHREVLQLRFFEGLAYREIKERTGLAATAWMSRSDRALEILKDMLVRNGLALDDFL